MDTAIVDQKNEAPACINRNCMHHLGLFIALSVLAEIVGTLGGFGSSLLFVPIASFFLDFHSVLGITALFHVASNLSKITLFRKGFDRKLIINIGLPSVCFVLLGAYGRLSWESV